MYCFVWLNNVHFKALCEGFREQFFLNTTFRIRFVFITFYAQYYAKIKGKNIDNKRLVKTVSTLNSKLFLSYS